MMHHSDAYAPRECFLTSPLLRKITPLSLPGLTGQPSILETFRLKH